jgi:hypothetical protein
MVLRPDLQLLPNVIGDIVDGHLTNLHLRRDSHSISSRVFRKNSRTVCDEESANGRIILSTVSGEDGSGKEERDSDDGGTVAGKHRRPSASRRTAAMKCDPKLSSIGHKKRNFLTVTNKRKGDLHFLLTIFVSVDRSKSWRCEISHCGVSHRSRIHSNF